MSKRVKMVLYGEPGTGKSVFASKAPKPFFICTDGNYEWLEDFGADPNAHLDCNSWSEMKSFLSKPENLKDYETIVIDLTEDAFKWCESEYCIRQKIEHLSDLGYGKAYDATRNEFFIEMCKLISLDKNVIFIMHGLHIVVKDRRGVEHTKYIPSSRIPDKVLDMIEGRVRYFLRCYIKDIEQEDGTVIKKRFLSLVPKPNEFGIIRGVDENKIPQDIPLEWDEFAKVIGLNEKVNNTKPTTYEETDEDEKSEPVKPVTRRRREKIVAEDTVKEDTVQTSVDSPIVDDVAPFDVPEEPKVEEQKPVEKPKIEQKPVEEPKVEKPKVSNEDKLAAIKAKLAMLNANK